MLLIKQVRRVVRILAIFFAITFTSIMVSNSVYAEFDPVVWIKKYGEAKYSRTFFKASAVPGRKELIVISTIESRTEFKGNRLEIFKIDEEGKLLASKIWAPDSDVAMLWVEDLVVRDTGEVVVCLRADNRLFLTFDANLELTESFKSPFDSDHEVTRMLGLLEGNLLIIGAHFSDGSDDSILMHAWVAKIDRSMNVSWQKEYDKGKKSRMVDAVIHEKKYFLLGNVSDEIYPLATGKSEIWAALLNADGEVESDIYFPGRYGSILTHPEGWLVFYDKGQRAERKYTFGLLKEPLELVSETLVFSDEGVKENEFPFFSWSFRTARVGSSIVVMRPANLKIKLSAWSDSQALLWESEISSLGASSNHSLISADESFFLFASPYDSTIKDLPKLFINVVKCRLPESAQVDSSNSKQLR